MSSSKPRVALVLGAGGVLGGAWMAGVLQALAETTRFYPRHADIVVGTSAGSVLATLGAAGVPPWLLIPELNNGIYHGSFDPDGKLELHQDMWARIVRRTRLGMPTLRPGSVAVALGALRRPSAYATIKLLSGLAPAGVITTQPIKESVQWVAPRGGWVHHPNCWIVAVDFQSGQRTVFGRPGAPQAGIAEAVAASCAIPGYYCPEPIAGRLYVDGGLHSMTNADVLRDENVDTVVVLSALSARHRFRGWNLVNRFTDLTRRLVAPVLDAEVAQLREQGKQVFVMEPTAADLVAIGGNLMDESRRGLVMRTAMRSYQERLAGAELAPLLRRLGRPAPPPKVPSKSPAPTAKPRLRPAV